MRKHTFVFNIVFNASVAPAGHDIKYGMFADEFLNFYVPLKLTKCTAKIQGRKFESLHGDKIARMKEIIIIHTR